MAKKNPKPHVTRTLGPIHFEDLDPHRFEDLVRQLVYDFRQWQSIESTGRGGADDGFDIRAYEVAPPSDMPNEEDSEEDAPRPMEGNLWMIQCKREGELGPKRVETIIHEAVKPNSPPYGYILAAPAHFSKAAHDKFREGLRSLGVMEFYLWGAGELEDLLYQPKNDRILFAFFGISLTSRRRSRTTEIRAAVNVKNKLRRVLGDTPNRQPVLLRDLQDAHYPYEAQYKDFEKRPRWKEYSVVGFHALGLIVSVAEYYAYVDKAKAEWDFTDAVNKIPPVVSHFGRIRHADNKRVLNEELRVEVQGFWEQLPRAKRTTVVRNGLVRFDEIAFIDDKGDTEYECPHLFVDFQQDRGPFAGSHEYLKPNEYQQESLERLKRVRFFPAKFSKPCFGTVHKDRVIAVDEKTRGTLKYGAHELTLYYADAKYSFLKSTDVIGVDKSEDQEGKQTLLKITNVRVATGQELLDICKTYPPFQQQIEGQLSRAIDPADAIQVVEAQVLSNWQIEQNRPVV